MKKTIVAPATPMGGAVSMIRISGTLTKQILEKLCKSAPKEVRKAYLTEIDTGTIKDKCIVILYSENASYTGEESAEIFCHGSAVVVREIIEFCLNNGAVLAEGGEFTMRAYLNRRIDLSEAEGILDLINAQTVEQAVSAYESANGKLREEISGTQQKLKEIIAAVDVAIDYPEEDIEDATKAETKKRLAPVFDAIDRLVKSYKDGYLIKNGVKVVICGKPNVGKSELFNALIGRNRAIVSEQEGTTRDFIESEYVYRGRKFVLVDTAGIRKTDNYVEEKGIEMMFEEIKSANLVLGVGVAGDEFDRSSLKGANDKIFEVTNKCDIRSGKNFNVSAKRQIGIDLLKEQIYEATNFDVKGLKLNNLRHYRALCEAKEYIESALGCELSLDCLCSDLMAAYDSLGKVTGAIGSDDIIAEIFSHFCVGK